MGIAKVYARLIYKGERTLESIPEKYQEKTIEAYYVLYGKKLELETEKVDE